MTSTNFEYDYYDVYLGGYAVDDQDERNRVAFILAEEQSRLYAIPCEWTILSDDGDRVRVRRKRYKDKSR